MPGIKIFIMSLLVSSLAACVVNEPAPAPFMSKKQPMDVNADYRILSMVTSGKENLDLKPGSRFFWEKPVEIIGSETLGQAELFRELINEDLVSKGFVLVENLQESDYQLTATVVLGKIPAGQAFVLDPGLLDHSGTDKGAIMIYISNPPPRQLWRGAAQVYTGEGLSEDFRVERSRKAVHGLLRDVRVTNTNR